MDKMTMAHDWAMKHGDAKTIGSREDMVKYAWAYANAMQAEADKRKCKPELPPLQQTFINGVEQPRYAPPCDEWQPDWSQAPNWARYWVKNINGAFSWYSKKPTAFDQGWFVGAGAVYTVCPAPTFNYKGDWEYSIRKRPEGK